MEGKTSYLPSRQMISTNSLDKGSRHTRKSGVGPDGVRAGPENWIAPRAPANSPPGSGGPIADSDGVHRTSEIGGARGWSNQPSAGSPISEQFVGAVREPPVSPQSGRKNVAHGASRGEIGPHPARASLGAKEITAKGRQWVNLML